MKLTIFNGSPRGSKANSNEIINWFKEGLTEKIRSETEVFKLKDDKKYLEMHRSTEISDVILVVFPLYTDAMPGIVKKFFDYLGENKRIVKGKQFIYVVHSGFPEATHSRGIERYLKRLTLRLQGEYLGTVVKGGSEGFRLMPPWMTRKTSKIFAQIASQLEKNGNLDKSLTGKLAKPERMKGFRLFSYKLMMKLGLSNMYWNGMLKKNKAWEKRFDAPYSDNY